MIGVRSSRTERRSALLMMTVCLMRWSVGERGVYFVEDGREPQLPSSGCDEKSGGAWTTRFLCWCLVAVARYGR